MSKIKVNKDVKANFRTGTARDLYYQAICSHNGKTVETFAKAVAENPPSLPTKGKLAGKPEPVSGWVKFFVREGYISLD